MSAGDGLADAVGDARHDHARPSRHGNHVDGVASAVGLLHEGERQHDAGAGLAAEVNAFAHVVIDTYNLVIDAIDADATATGVSAAREEFLVGLLLDDAHFAMAKDVGLINKSAVKQFRFVDALIVRHGSTDADGSLAIAVVGCAAI